MENNVKFPGFVDDVDDRINRAMIYVSSSNYEGISNSMIEALAMGVPCICTDCPVGGAKMMIENHINGVLVPVGDFQKMYIEMLNIIENDDFRANISREAIKIRDIYSIIKITDMWENLIN